MSSFVVSQLADEFTHGKAYLEWAAGYERALGETLGGGINDPFIAERILRYRATDGGPAFYTESGTEFIPLPKRYGNEEYLRHLNENVPENPIDSYAVICNHNPHDFRLKDTPNYNFGHTWLQLNVGGDKNYQIQYYSSPNQLGNLAKSATGKAIDGAALGVAVSEIADGVLRMFLDKRTAKSVAAAVGFVTGAADAAVNTVYHTAVQAKVIEDTAQLSFHNALVIPIRRRAAEVMAVDAIIDSKGYTGRYNFTNTMSNENPRTGNCTRDAMLRLNEVGIPITEAVLSITPKDERGTIPGYWSRLWQVALRPGLASRAFRTLKPTNAESIELTVQDKNRDKKHGDEKGLSTTFSFQECTMSGDKVDKLPVILIENQIDKGAPPPTWHNLSDVLIQFAKQKGKGIFGGRLVDVDVEGVDEYVRGFMPTAFVENGLDAKFKAESLSNLMQRVQSSFTYAGFER